MKTYKLQADVTNGVLLVSDFEVEPTSPEIFYMLLSDPDCDDVIAAEVDRAMYHKIGKEYGITAVRELAAITDERGKVWYAASVPIDATRIVVAATDITGCPVNFRIFKVSRSKRNLAIAFRDPAQRLVEHRCGPVTFYTE